MSIVKSTSELRNIWNEFAERYINNFLNITTQVNSLLVPLLRLSETHTLCETGCGSGSGVEIILKQFPNIHRILASDLSEAMINHARSKNLPNTELFVSSSEELPFESESCDRYISNFVFQLVENPSKAMQEAWRVLKTGGIAVFSVWGKAEKNNFLVTTARSMKNVGVESTNERSGFHLNDREALIRLAKDAGFTNAWGFYTAVPIPSTNADELVYLSCIRPDVITLKNSNFELYERFACDLKAEFQKILDNGEIPSSDVLILLAEKF